MVTVPKEKSFPRGGRVERTDAPRRKTPDWCKNKFSVRKKKDFQIKQKTFKSKNTTSNVYEKDEFDFPQKHTETQNKNVIRPYSGPLKYRGISEGMLILGCIYKIEPYKLGISLPGNCIGYAPIMNISEPYRRALSSLVKGDGSNDVHYLRDMFHVGQHVVTKVMKNEGSDEDNPSRNEVVLSLLPEDIHSEWSSRGIRAQSVFTAAVGSIEEKVYVMDVGIKSVRAVMKKQHAETFKRVWNEGKELGIGQLVRCVVLKVTSEKSVSTLTLSADPYAVAKASYNKIGSALRTFLPGMLFDVTVARHLFPSGIQVRLSENVTGYVPHNHFPKSFRKAEDFEIGSIHPARVLYISKSGAVFFTMKKNICSAQPLKSPFKNLKAGFITDSAVVWSTSEIGLTVKLVKSDNVSFKGFIPMSHVTRKDGDHPVSMEFPVGSSITCRVMDYCYMDQYYVCTMKQSLLKEPYIHASSLKVGVVVSCTIKEITPKGISVTLGKHSPLTAFVPKLHMADVPLSHPEKKFNVNQTCTARVLRLDNCVHLTMKPSLIQSVNILTSYDSAEIGKRYVGTVVHRNTSGILVEFFCNITGWINRSYLSKKSLPPSAIETEFYLGKVVICTVTGKDHTSRKLILSLIAEGTTSQGDANSTSQDDENATNDMTLNENQGERKSQKRTIEDTVGPKKKLKHSENTDGNKVDESKVTSKKSRKQTEDHDTSMRLEHLLKTKTLHDDVNETKKKRKSVPVPTDAKSGVVKIKNKISNITEVDGDEAGKRTKKKKKCKDNSGESMEEDAETNNQSAADDTFTIIDLAEGTSEKKKRKSVDVNTDSDTMVELPSLSVKGGFVWDVTSVKRSDAEDDSSDEDEHDNNKKKEKKSRQAIIAEKRHQAQLEEARLRTIEQRLMDPEQVPETADEFDRLLLASPDNSMLWLQYMAHHIQATEIDKARNVARRALKTISFREEQEKLNVWMALLNLENLYGTVDSVKSTLDEAVKLNDPFNVYTQMLQIYADSHKLVEGDELVATMTKKFKSMKDMWINVATFYMNSGQLLKARTLLQRSLNNLEKREYVSVISQFALLENKLGSQERAQTLMEQILTSYPKRVDVWCVYVDMLVKSSLITMARQVLERAVAQRLQTHKMKVLFKKFLAFEEAHGTEENANKVRQMALEYVEAATSTNTD